MTITKNKQNILTSAWDKMDYKKTLTAFLLAVCYSILIGNGILESNENAWKLIIALGGVGLIHKTDKFIKS